MSLSSGRQWLLVDLHLHCEEYSTLKPQCASRIFKFPDTSGVVGKKGHIYGSVALQHVWLGGLVAEHRVASLVPFVFEFFVIRQFDAATFDIEGREGSV